MTAHRRSADPVDIGDGPHPGLCWSTYRFSRTHTFVINCDVGSPDVFFHLHIVEIMLIALPSVTSGMDHLQMVDHSGPLFWSVLAFVCVQFVVTSTRKPLVLHSRIYMITPTLVPVGSFNSVILSAKCAVSERTPEAGQRSHGLGGNSHVNLKKDGHPRLQLLFWMLADLSLKMANVMRHLSSWNVNWPRAW